MGMIFALLPFGTAAYAQDTPISTDAVCPPPGETASNEFPDDNGSVHESNINCVAQYGIAQGFVDGTYRPSENISRGQMATFIANMVETALGENLPAGSDAFDDDDGTTHETNINKVANAGIVSGRGGGNYDPGGFVDRAAMATFIAQAIDYADDEDVNGSEPPAATEDEFPDDTLSTHHDNINRLANQDIIVGFEDGLFHPNQLTTRAQMATFIVQGAAYLDSIGEWAPTADGAVPPPTTNQSFDVTPDAAATNTVSSSGTTNEGARQYSVSGLTDTESFDIILFPAENVTVSDTEQVSFTDTTPSDNVADWTAFGPTGPNVEVVNGTSTGDTNGHVVDVSPVNGTISFTIDSETQDEVIPVLTVADAGSSDGTPDLDLNASDQPTQDFGIGGQKNWVPVEAATGTHTVRVETVNRGDDFFVADTNNDSDGPDADDRTFFYDANDTYQVDGGGISMSEFEALLSGHSATLDGDSLTIGYSQNPDLVSTFNVTTDRLPPPTNLKSSVSDLDGDGTADDTTLTWTASTQPDAIYNVYIDTVADNTFGVGDTAVQENVSGTSVTINNAVGNTYHVGAEGGTSGDRSTGDPSVAVTAPAANVAPLAIDTVVTSNSGFANTFDTGDVFKVVFNEGMAAPDSGDTIRAEDEDGANDTTADFINGTNSTWTLNASAETVNGVSRPAGTVITVTLTAPPTVVTAGDVAGLQIPADIIDQAGTADDDGAGWDITAANQDLTIDQDANDNDANSADTTAPTIQSAEETGANQLTVTFSEAVWAYDGNDRSTDCTDLGFAQFVFDGDLDDGTDEAAASPTSCTGLGTNTVVFTFTAATGIDNDGTSDGTFAYTDDNAALEAGDGVDAGVNQLADHPATATTDPA